MIYGVSAGYCECIIIFGKNIHWFAIRAGQKWLYEGLGLGGGNGLLSQKRRNHKNMTNFANMNSS